MTRLIILDFDGTLADTREIIVRTNQEVQRRMGYPLTSEEGIMATVGLPLKECIMVMYPDLPVDIQMGRGAGVRTCGVSFGNFSPGAAVSRSFLLFLARIV